MCRSTNTVPHVLMTSTITPQPLPPPPPQAPQPSQPINNSSNRRINIDSSPPEPFNIARIVTQVEEGKKSVRFANIDDDQADEIRYFERISFIDAKNVWYNESELYSFVQEGKKLALAYRNTLTTTSTTTTSTTTNAHAHAHQEYCYRGFENYTIERQKHRLLSNRFNVLIQHRNSKDNDISINTVNDDDIQQLDDISQQCSNWSTNVALLTAINDYFVSYGGDDEDGDNNYCDETSSFFPSVTDMIPPEFPIGIQRIMLFSSSIAIQQSRKRTIRTTQQAASTANSNVSNSNSDVIRRRVKQRVVY